MVETIKYSRHSLELLRDQDESEERPSSESLVNFLTNVWMAAALITCGIMLCKKRLSAMLQVWGYCHYTFGFTRASDDKTIALTLSLCVNRDRRG